MRIIGIPWFRGGVVVGGPVLVSVGVDWFRCCGVIRGSVRGFGRLCGRCAGGCSPCVYEIVGIPRFCGGAVVGSPVSVWTGSVFGSQFRIWSAGSGRCEAGVPVGSLVFSGFAVVPWSVGTRLVGLLWTGLVLWFLFRIWSVDPGGLSGSSDGG